METGEKKIAKHTVTEAETADKIGSGGLPVFSTPSMTALMEKTAFGLAKENGHDTVGTRLEISHLKACLPGTELTCEAELTDVDGRKLCLHFKDLPRLYGLRSRKCRKKGKTPSC